MLEFKKIYSLNNDTAKFITDLRRQIRLPQTDAAETPRFLNQEKDGMVLFTWDDAAESSKGSIVTHVGLYDPVQQKHQLIWTYNQRVQIVSCSVNQARSLLAFTVMHKDGTAGKKKEVYTAFLAEIQASSTRVFSLNLERPHFLKVQFLYCNQVSAKECHMIVMLHRESIGLYRIQLGRVGEKGIVMRDQPTTEQLAKKFYWCQWDCQHQRLYYIQYQRQGKGDNIKFQPVLSSLQFYEHAQYDNVLDILINFPFPQIRASPRQHYSTFPLHSGIPDPFLNLVVLSQSNGTFCICYQHLTETPYSVDRSRSSSRRSHKSPQHPSPASLTMSMSSDDDQMEMSYYICMVHHAKVLHGHVSGLPFSLKHRLHFSWHGDYLMVLLPGQFVHLLNVGIEYEPCHHILIQDKTLRLQAAISSIGPSEDQPHQHGSPPPIHITQSEDKCMPIPVLSPEAEKLSHLSNTCLFGIQKDSPKEACLFDHRHGDVWKVTVNMDALVHIFTQSYMSSMRSALLHYVLIRTRDFWLVKRLFEMLSNDIASVEVPGLMAEFLTGTTYASMRRQCDRELLRLLPFTVAETFRGQYDKNQHGDWLAQLSYSSLSSVKIGTRTAQERQKRNVADDIWDTLRRHLQWMQLSDRSRRFSQDVIRKANHQLQRSSGSGRSHTNKETSADSKTFLSNFHTRISSYRTESPTPSLTIDGSKRVRPDTVLGLAPPFLQSSAITEQSEYLTTLTKEFLSNHLCKHLRKDSKIKSQNVAKEYVYCQIQQSRQLCHLLWHLRGPLLPYTDLDLLPNLLDPSTEDEYELFQLFERYYLTCQDFAFPIPQGFSSYFTAVGSRTLSRCLFLQYVDRGVLSLTGDFMAQVLSDLSNEDVDVKLKHQLISRLPKNLALECFHHWNHHTCQKYLATRQVTELLTGSHVSSPGTMEALGSQSVSYRSAETRSIMSTRDSLTFPPLVSFLQQLEKLDAANRIQNKTKFRRSPIDIHFLDEVSLYHTRSDTQYDMSTVNF